MLLAVCVFWKLIPGQLHHLKIPFPILWGAFFVLFVFFFAVQKFLSLIKSHLVNFVFIFITLGSVSKKILLRFISKSV